MATLASALLARDMSVEQAKEQQALNDYYERIGKGSWKDALLGFGGQALGTMIGGPLGGFLGKQVGKYGSRAARGGFEGPPELSGGKFYKQQMRDTLSDIDEQQSLFNASMIMDMGADALGAFNKAGGMKAVGKEGLGTLMTKGSGPGATSGFLGATERAGGSGIGLGGWKGMQLDATKYLDADGNPLPDGTELTAGDVYERDPYTVETNPKVLRSNPATTKYNVQRVPSTATAYRPKLTTVAGETRKPAFFQYQMGMTPKTSEYSQIADPTDSDVFDLMRKLYSQ